MGERNVAEGVKVGKKREKKMQKQYHWEAVCCGADLFCCPEARKFW